MAFKKTDLLKPNDPRANELHALVREINDREDVIAALKGKTIGATNDWICEVILQGGALNRAKAMLPHGVWMDWLKAQCPLISQSTANTYMRLATNSQRAVNLAEATSIRMALQLCAQNNDNNEAVATSRRWPPYIEALGRFSKFVGYVERNPMDKWPEEGRTKLRAELEPLVTFLWPEKFAA